MLASGIGASVICVNPQHPDTTAEVVAAARTVQRLGVRAAVVYPFADAMDDLHGRAPTARGGGEEIARRLDAVEAIAAEYDGGLIEVQLGPVGPQWVSEATLAAVGSHARRTGRRVHMHLLESPANGCGPTAPTRRGSSSCSAGWTCSVRTSASPTGPSCATTSWAPWRRAAACCR